MIMNTHEDTRGLQHSWKVDYLRGISILGVLFYHFLPNFVPGGYLGVDVFFVLSGFLISNSILSEIESGKFRLFRFYARRLVRILPALLVLLLFVGLAGWVYLTPGEFQLLGKHQLASLMFVSNFLLSSEAGYFDFRSMTKPLLHMWSLSVEEQFYLVWPVLIAMSGLKVFSKSHRGLLVGTAIGAALSLSFFIWHSRVDETEAFFHTLSRAWQLAVGSLIAIFLRTNLVRGKSLVSVDSGRRNQWQRFELASLILIVGCLVVPRPEIHLNAWQNILIVAGAALFIFSAAANLNLSPASPPGKASQVICWFGTRSYSLYLWHWPVAVYIGIVSSSDPSSKLKILGLVCSLSAALLSYRYIEKPCLKFPDHQKQRLALALTAVALWTWALFLEVYKGTIPPQNDDPFVVEVDRAATDILYFEGFQSVNGAQTINSEVIETLFVGDSLAGHYAPRFRSARKMPSISKGVGFFTLPGCPPLPGVRSRLDKRCDGFFERIVDYIESQDGIKKVVFAAQWVNYLDDGSKFYYRRDGLSLKRSAEELRNYIQTLQKSRGIDVYIVLNLPSSQKLEKNWILSRQLSGRIERRIESFNFREYSSIATTDALLQETLGGEGVFFLDPKVSLCPKDLCSPIDQNSKLIYADCCHLRASFVRGNVDWLDPIFRDR